MLGPAAADVAEPERLSAVRRGGAAAGRASCGATATDSRSRSIASAAGRVVWGMSPEKVLQQSRRSRPTSPAGQPWRFIHRSTGDAEIYFVANGQPFEATATCSFRVAGKSPGAVVAGERAGSSAPASAQQKDGVTHVVAARLGRADRCSSCSASRSQTSDPVGARAARRQDASLRDAGAAAEGRRAQGPLRRAGRPAAHARRDREGPAQGRRRRTQLPRDGDGRGRRSGAATS